MKSGALGSLVIRADGGPRIGTGHLVRCLTLGARWRARGGEVVMFASGVPAVLLARARRAGVRVKRLARPGVVNRGLLAAMSRASWVVLDGYHFSEGMRRRVRAAAQRLLLIEDRAQTGTPRADVLLDTNLGAAKRDYPKQGATTRFLLGPRFALIRPEFRRQRPPSARPPTAARRLLITFGGAPDRRVLALAGRALEQCRSQPLATLVAGFSKSPKVKTPPRTRFLNNVKDMAALMARHDFALASPGTTSWELCFMGLPTVMVAIADNQLRIGAALGRQGVVRYLGPWHGIDAAIIARALDDLVADGKARRAMGRKGRRLVDGRGVDRVIDAMRDVHP